MRQKGKFESKEKTRKRNREKRKGCFFECLIFLFGVVIVVLLNIPDDSLSGLEVFDIGVIALFLTCSVCSGGYGIYKMIRKRKNKKRTSPGEGGTANAVTDVGHFESVSPDKSMNTDS